MASKPRVYLDNCCFNRPYDNQSQPLIRLETEAKLLIQKEVIDDRINLVWSFILRYENGKNPYKDRRRQILLWERKAVDIVVFDSGIQSRMMDIMQTNIRTKDALHISCAIRAKADFFITTDKKLLNKSIEGITIINPVDFLRRYFDEN